ncbi:MAG: class II glutamine amidotransferase, partial [Actinomycetota bacterium]|nr:class II glutamine amidotransferase [Actinomycetota bacterium]
MCRHLARLGAPTTLQALLFDPPHSLVEQASAPRRQRYGRINADGFGAGWYAAGLPAPVRFRRAQPIWSDRSFASLAPAVSAVCVLAAVRSATVGYPVDESCAAPFTAGPWLFSHNGAVADPVRLRRAAAGALDRLDAPDCRAPVDSALLFALALAAWCRGASVGDGLAEALRVAVAAGGGRLNLLATDG